MLELSGLVLFLAWIGAISIYVSGGGFTGTFVYKALKGKIDDGSDVVMAALAGIFWPIVVPLGFAVGIVMRLVEGWVYAGGNINLSKELGSSDYEEPSESNGNSVDDDEEDEDWEDEEDEPKFKPGDLVTGVKGNPAEYECYYEGCKCRVLECDSEEFRSVLVDHVDKEAHKNRIGEVEDHDSEYFELIKQPRKRTVRKKPVIKKKPVKKKN